MTKTFHQYGTSAGIVVYATSVQAAESFFKKQSANFNAVWQGTRTGYFNSSDGNYFVNGSMLDRIARGIYVSWDTTNLALKRFNF